MPHLASGEKREGGCCGEEEEEGGMSTVGEKRRATMGEMDYRGRVLYPSLYI